MMGRGLSIYESMQIFKKVACCTITELTEIQYSEIMTSITKNLGCGENMPFPLPPKPEPTPEPSPTPTPEP